MPPPAAMANASISKYPDNRTLDQSFWTRALTEAIQPKNDRPDLLKALLESKTISKAQADLAQADQQMTGMTVEEVLIARGWVTKEVLAKVAPWLQEDAAAKKAAPAGDNASGSISGDYLSNLQKYRELVSKILGEKKG